MFEKQYSVYIMTNYTNKVLYIGVTSNLVQRVYQHKTKSLGGFTAKYNVTKLVYFESTTEVTSAIEREKQLKDISRQKKIDLITSINPNFSDLYEKII
jgi:putative endonuclease